MSEFAGLSYEELVAEIEREKGVLTDLDARLAEVQNAEAQANERVVRERDPRLWERRRQRAEAISALALDVAEREARISRLATRIGELEAYAVRPDISAVERYITRRTISILRRTVGALRGWQTRKERTIRSLRGWQTRELALEPRLRELYDTLSYWTRETSLLTARIETEKARLTRKKEELKKLVKYQHKIIVCNIDTTRAGVRIVISITLWFDVRIDVQERFEREAIGKIHRWLDQSFYGNISGVPEHAKLSEEEKRPAPSVVKELTEKDELVTDIHYKWFWSRTRRGVEENTEEREGDITWEEDIPLTSGAGARRGKKRGEV
ncbi:hypothetical protein ES702_02213 [subsurface metagenome]